MTFMEPGGLDVPDYEKVRVERKAALSEAEEVRYGKEG